MSWLRLPASPRWRIFLVAWVLFSAHFATNVVREHYPAFSLAEHGTFRVDDYQGFHPDIFVHADGHAYINNQVFVSALAAVPLFVFDPALDALQAYRLRQLQAGGGPDGDYRTDKPLRRAFFDRVAAAGLDLRFGAATVVTSVFFMAPLTALFLVVFYGVLRCRGVEARDAAGLAMLLGFATPLFFRTSTLNHNMFVMYGMFAAFALLWPHRGQELPVLAWRRYAAGFFGGVTLATDYIGVVVLPLLWAYLVLSRRATAPWPRALRESVPMVAGSLPPVFFLLYSQWAMFGDPFLPAQYWMEIGNPYATEGLRGFSWPALDLLWQNLFHPGFGLFVWAPLLALALVPATGYRPDSLILPRRERWFVIAAFAALLLFSSANQFARLQWNSGFRYLVPLVPFLMLALADHWRRLPAWARWSLAVPAVLHAWVLAVFRETAGRSWELFLAEGPQLPWLRVLRMTSSPESGPLHSVWLPIVLLAATAAVALLIWRGGARLDARGAGWRADGLEDARP